MFKNAKAPEWRPLPEWDLKSFIETVEKQFVFSEQAAEAVFNGLTGRKNLLLWGPAGHAKSDLIDYCLKMIVDPAVFYSDVFNATCGQRMPTEPIRGFQDIVAFKEGRFAFNVENSMFTAYQYANLDEGLEMPEWLALYTRSAITAGQQCENGICYPNSLKWIGMSTNRDPEQWAGTDESRISFIDRFVLQLKVVWPEYTAKAFDTMFERRSHSSPVWAEMCETIYKMNTKWSPRMAMTTLPMYEQQGLRSIRSVRGITPAIYTALEEIEKARGFITTANTVSRASRALEQALADNSRPLKDILADVARLQVRLQEAGKIPSNGKLLEEVALTRKRLTQVAVKASAREVVEAATKAENTW